MRALALIAALLVVTLRPSPASAQVVKETPETIKLTGDLKHYQALVAAYRQGRDDVVAEILASDEARLSKTIAAINSIFDPNKPWRNDFLRSGALLQTAAGLQAADEGHPDRMKLHFGLAASQLRQGSADLEPFAGRWYYAVARYYRSHNGQPLGVFDAETLLEHAREHLPSNPLVLYESATIAELRATAWQSAQIRLRSGIGGSFRDANALDDIVKDRAARLQNAREWLRLSVATAPTPLSRLHFGRVLMMRKEDDEALLQLEAARKETRDRATQYLALVFAAGVHERRGRLELAARTYQQAVECFPESDAAYIGLSEVLQASGQGDQARTILRELLKPRAERHEPWTWYFLEPKSVARERIAALFEEGRR